jgi:membrane protein involved in colicin uptake
VEEAQDEPTVSVDEEDAKRDAARKVKEEAKEEAKKKAAAEAEAEAQQEGEDTKAPAVLTLTMPALVPTPLDEIADELQMERGPSAGKKRKGGKWTVINSEE